ncbi:MAG: nitrilase-related carbon-nitrogen hydrolase [Capsulimonadales bacterium]|nr:nitrilase-related carbon-nitrogen hydrolase [Capsulimonadales bacterium]
MISAPSERSHTVRLFEFGENVHRGNLVGVQARMTPADYVSGDRFKDKLRAYLLAARSCGWLGPRTTVVFPEHIGTWLILSGEDDRIAREATLSGALRRFAFRHLPALVRGALVATEADRVAATLFRIKAPRMARLYQEAFSGLAADFEVTVVGGTTVLPDPAITPEGVVAGTGPLRNVAVVFRPDGQPYSPPILKVFPTGAEQAFLRAPERREWPVLETPAGRLGVLICADAWYPEPYAALKAQGVEWIVVPSHATGIDTWRKPWPGYDGAPMPTDVLPGDVNRLTEAEAWQRYALAGRIAASGAKAGINVFLSGVLWDLGAQGDSLVVRTGEPPHLVEGGQAAMIKLWL